MQDFYYLNGPSFNKVVFKLSNVKPYYDFKISRSLLMEGAKIEFEMGDSPKK
ncbi:hypothetical protein ACFSOV_07165 [Pedobacter petrophilus]|uniref:hypothetical protein n=1 Tax=Pedobacter petrophilus TaxID=1908241 RepID=UPI0036321466